MHKVQSLISLLVVASILTLCLPLFDMVYLYPATTSLISEKMRKDAENLGRYLARDFVVGEDARLINSQLQKMKESFSLVRASLCSPAGEVLYSTAKEQIGQRRDLAPLRRAMRQGESYSRYLFANLPGRDEAASLLEIQAPLDRNGELLAVLELIHDVSPIRSSMERTVSHASTFLLLVAGLFFALILLLARMARRALSQQDHTEQLLRESQQLLEQKHEELNKLFQLVEQAKQEWQLTLDCISDMILLVDAEDKVKRCNEALVRFIGLTYLGVLGKDWKKVLFTEGVEVVKLSRQHSEIYHPRHKVWLGIEFYPYRDDQGERFTVIRVQQLQRRRGETSAA